MPAPKTTLRTAYANALDHWSGASHVVMAARASVCCKALGWDLEAATLGPAHGVKLLASLRATRGPKSVVDYYSTFRRMLALSGVPTATWPSAPKVPRVKAREPIPTDDLQRGIEWLDAMGYTDTGDLMRVLRGTGMRVAVEGLREGAYDFTPASDTLPATLRIRGKGGHERLIPVLDEAAVAVLGRVGDVRWRETSYSAHRRRWKRAMVALGVTSRLPTPHAIRHSYLTDALEKSGGSLVLVMELAGHSDPKTTARYLAVDMEAKARALSGS